MFKVVRRSNFIPEPYRFENGTPFNRPSPPPPFVPDRNFDGDSIYGLRDWTTPVTEAGEPPTSLAPSESEKLSLAPSDSEKLIISLAPAAAAVPSPAKT